jgi:hypothetical protein
MTGRDVITMARRQLADDQGEKRWSDAALLAYLVEGQDEIVRQRPETRLGLDGARSTVAAVADLSAALTLDASWRGALADYVCFRAFSEDAADEANASRAQQHYQLYQARLAS